MEAAAGHRQSIKTGESMSHPIRAKEVRAWRDLFSAVISLLELSGEQMVKFGEVEIGTDTEKDALFLLDTSITKMQHRVNTANNLPWNKRRDDAQTDQT